MKLIDLSYPFDATLFGDRHDQRSEIDLQAIKTVESSGVSTMRVTLGTHVGTHIDAPSHLIAEGATIDGLSLDRFHGDAVVLDIPKGPNGAISASDLAVAAPTV